MLRSKYPEALRVADDASNLFKSNGFIRNQVLQVGLGGGNSDIFVFSPGTLGKMNPFLMFIFFKWVGSTTNQLVFFRSFFSPKLKLRMGEEKWYSNGAIGKFISLGHTAKTSLKSFHHRARRACSGRMPSVPWKSIEKPKVQHWRCIAVKDKRQRIQQAMSTANSAFTK